MYSSVLASFFRFSNSRLSDFVNLWALVSQRVLELPRIGINMDRFCPAIFTLIGDVTD